MWLNCCLSEWYMSSLSCRTANRHRPSGSRAHTRPALSDTVRQGLCQADGSDCRLPWVRAVKACVVLQHGKTCTFAKAECACMCGRERRWDDLALSYIDVWLKILRNTTIDRMNCGISGVKLERGIRRNATFLIIDYYCYYYYYYYYNHKLPDLQYIQRIACDIFSEDNLSFLIVVFSSYSPQSN
jgi:hypothetical protein